MEETPRKGEKETSQRKGDMGTKKKKKAQSFREGVLDVLACPVTDEYVDVIRGSWRRRMTKRMLARNFQ